MIDYPYKLLEQQNSAYIKTIIEQHDIINRLKQENQELLKQLSKFVSGYKTCSKCNTIYDPEKIVNEDGYLRCPNCKSNLYFITGVGYETL